MFNGLRRRDCLRVLAPLVRFLLEVREIVMLSFDRLCLPPATIFTVAFEQVRPYLVKVGPGEYADFVSGIGCCVKAAIRVILFFYLRWYWY